MDFYAQQPTPAPLNLQDRDTIFILLATFNGAKFLPELLQSLIDQEYTNWILLVRDDGSTDQTHHFLQNFALTQSKMRWLFDDFGRLGVTKSFEQLMGAALCQGANFFALCDQDDVWLPKKLAELRVALCDDQAGGFQFIDLNPALAYSDLTVVGADLKLKSHSFFKMNHSGGAWRNPSYWLLSHNLVPGCAMLGNRALIERSLPFPNEAIIHDWWLLLCAASMGRVAVVERPLILYRQHDQNTIGVQSLRQKMKRFLTGLSVQCAEKQNMFTASILQVRALYRRLKPELEQERTWRGVIAAMFAGMLATSRWKRLLAVLLGPVRRTGLARNVLLICIVWHLRTVPKLQREIQH